MIFMMDSQCQPQMYDLALWSIVLQLTLACCTACCFAPLAQPPPQEGADAGEVETLVPVVTPSETGEKP